jgi:hypothetical protein
MRTPSSQKCRLDLVPPLADRFILGIAPSITARYFSASPSDSTSRWTPCPPEYHERWLQVRLGCVQLSLSCPFRPLHTFRLSPASEAANPASWIWRSSFERQRDFNPPEQRAAQRTLPNCRPPRHNRAIRFQDHRFPLGVRLCRTVLSSTDDKNLSRKTHPAICGVPTQSFERLMPHFSQLLP